MVVASIHQLAAVLRGRREHVGMTQAEVATRAGIARKTVNEIESGRAAPRFANLLQVLEALDLELSISSPGTPDRTPPASTPHPVSLDSVLDRYRSSGGAGDG